MEWQDIETAPKDGTEILLFVEKTPQEHIFGKAPFRKTFQVVGHWGKTTIRKYLDGKYQEGWLRDGARSGITGRIIHWMPLPLPPSEQEQ
jgi:hypothetical protein